MTNFDQFFYRTAFVGICSGAARIGAITGIVMDEMKLLHPNVTASIVTGMIFLQIGLLFRIIPDLTKSKLPLTWEDTIKIKQTTMELSTDPENQK